jgi:hypothetical protein
MIGNRGVAARRPANLDRLRTREKCDKLIPDAPRSSTANRDEARPKSGATYIEHASAPDKSETQCARNHLPAHHYDDWARAEGSSLQNMFCGARVSIRTRFSYTSRCIVGRRARKLTAFGMLESDAAHESTRL